MSRYIKISLVMIKRIDHSESTNEKSTWRIHWYYSVVSDSFWSRRTTISAYCICKNEAMKNNNGMRISIKMLIDRFSQSGLWCEFIYDLLKVWFMYFKVVLVPSYLLVQFTTVSDEWWYLWANVFISLLLPIWKKILFVAQIWDSQHQ